MSRYAPMLCCLCGDLVPEPTDSRTCQRCLLQNVNIANKIPNNTSLLQCCTCKMFYHNHWLNIQPESKELLSLCIRKTKGLDKLQIVDSKFLWTEPHSKRIKVQYQLRSEIDMQFVVEQQHVVEYSIRSTQCDKCKQSFTPHTWDAMVQIRHKVEDKKEILFLEQAIIKHHAQENVIRIIPQLYGFDLHFGCKSHAQKFVEFVCDRTVSQVKHSKKLITHDSNNNSYKYKYSTNVDMAEICRDDLIYLPMKFVSQFGGVSPFLLCISLNKTITLVDPFTLRKLEISADKYWRNPFFPVYTRSHLSQFIVANIEERKLNPIAGAKYADQYQLVDLELIPNGGSEVIYTISHLGKQLKPGDTCVGYDLRCLNTMNEQQSVAMEKIQYDVIIVKKMVKKHKKNRPWVLKSLTKNTDISFDDLENFKDDLDDLEELRNDIIFYKNPTCEPPILPSEFDWLTEKIHDLSLDNNEIYIYMTRLEKKKNLFSKAEKLENEIINLEKQKITAYEIAKQNDLINAEQLASEIEGYAELGNIDNDPYLLEEAEYIKTASGWKNKQRVLLFCSRGVSSTARHLLSDLKLLIPHHVSEHKWEKREGYHAINELCELNNCNNVLYIESRKVDLYLWMAKSPSGPTVKFQLLNVHTLDEILFSGNSILYSRPLVIFDKNFSSNVNLRLYREMLLHIFGTPRNHPKSKPFFDHCIAFYFLDNKIFMRHYQISPITELDINKPTRQLLIEIGPRLVLEPISILSGSFCGNVLWNSPTFISPNKIRSLLKKKHADRYLSQNLIESVTKMRNEIINSSVPEDENSFENLFTIKS